MPRDVEFLQQRVEIGLAPAAVGLHHLEHRADVVLDIEAAEDRRFLRQIADAEPGALIHRQVGDVVAVELDDAAVGLDQPGDHVERGGLAGAVRSEQADRLAAPDIEADVLDDLASAVALFEAVGREIVVANLGLRVRGSFPVLALSDLGGFRGLAAGVYGVRAETVEPGLLMPTAVGALLLAGQAPLSEQRQNIDHACLNVVFP